MACLFSLSTRANIVRRRYNASFSYVLNDDRKHNSIDEGPSLEGMGNLFQQKSFGSSSNRFNNNNDSAVFGFFHNRRCSDTGVSFCRHMSTKIGAASEKIEFINDVADVITDRTVEAAAAQAPAMDEVAAAAAAADSYFPVAALQHVIDAVHSFIGFNWYWAIWFCLLMYTVH
ncbi:PREDICTED: mitochondrial inner membrane protein OXA1-like [Populus euphratica]|uniref:Mitochondrial inner membrane protein OXA1-like n=1 Tax=Populus euphratica TaxID=75702 RepID=A0AAJ6U4E0_POPEU|nr:PREDICTED: mitochondrial inner membrane protein OXA1-like [Populus euphratica]